jgi:predicted NAD/FAD-binding protein
MLEDPSDTERELLAAIPYQDNDVVLHTDAALLPRSRRAWASWNYHIPVERQERAVLTYHMNTLQSIEAPEEFCVTLNRTDEIDPGRIVIEQTMAHPVYLPGSVEAQRRHGEISGVRRTHYCGAYWANGFHEDGVKSALAACAWFGKGQLN